MPYFGGLDGSFLGDLRERTMESISVAPNGLSRVESAEAVVRLGCAVSVNLTRTVVSSGSNSTN